MARWVRFAAEWESFGFSEETAQNREWGARMKDDWIAKRPGKKPEKRNLFRQLIEFEIPPKIVFQSILQGILRRLKTHN